MKRHPASVDLSPSEYLQRRGSKARAKNLSRFFKCGPGEYGEGDQFLGISMPELRKAVRIFADIPESVQGSLLKSPFHEERMLGLLLWSERAKRADFRTQKIIARKFLRQSQAANNWDLIDVTVPGILGPVVLAGEPGFIKTLRKYIRSRDLWLRRIALLATFPLIRRGDFGLTLEFCEAVRGDSEDLIHKAAGWMLREIGKKDLAPLRAFLEKHATTLPRTMLRYSIEKLSRPEQKKWMKRA